MINELGLINTIKPVAIAVYLIGVVYLFIDLIINRKKLINKQGQASHWAQVNLYMCFILIWPAITIIYLFKNNDN